MPNQQIPWIITPPDNYRVMKTMNGEPFFVHSLAEITRSTKIGRYTYIHGTSRFSGDKEILIGNFCSIASGVRIQTGDEHDFKRISTFPFSTILGMDLSYPEVRGEGVSVGHDVWIGEGARLLAGSKVPNGVVIGAGSVVRGKLVPYGIYAGNPAVLRRMRCEESVVEFLEELQWWDWEVSKILNNSLFFSSFLKDDIAELSKSLKI